MQPTGAAKATQGKIPGIKTPLQGHRLESLGHVVADLPYLDGTELDFAREGLNEGFKFNNPNVKDACGCGESFNV